MFQDESQPLCRLCGGSCSASIDIFINCIYGILISSVLKDILQLDVTTADGLPSTICYSCQEKVVDFKFFKTMCINTRIEFLKAGINRSRVTHARGQPQVNFRRDSSSSSSSMDEDEEEDDITEDSVDVEESDESESKMSEDPTEVGGKPSENSLVFQCTKPGCNRTFKSKKSLSNHGTRMHSGGRFKCPFCSYKAYSLACLDKHIRTHKEITDAGDYRLKKKSNSPTKKESKKVWLSATAENSLPIIHQLPLQDGKVGIDGRPHFKQSQKSTGKLSQTPMRTAMEKGDKTPEKKTLLKKKSNSPTKKESKKVWLSATAENSLPIIHQVPLQDGKVGIDGRPHFKQSQKSTAKLSQTPMRTAMEQEDKTPEKKTLFCKVCVMPFQNRTSLRAHMEQMHNKLTHNCHRCSKTFVKYQQYRKHSEMHQKREEMPYVCPRCGADFHSVNRIREHMETRHSYSTVIVCEVCRSAFPKSGMDRHDCQLFRNLFPCPLCKQRFRHRGSVKAHVMRCKVTSQAGKQ
ncbi:zinc finger Y-chromosomal protein-like isoform X3 [Ischnura elegans]|uniref:zinc finger Y-chromosomal protein-like isoform X3 n=1 Tax=Ischnura elegans TaxID=197161 RepID=UPI001ED88909|nr:zinc finger Y-chromosomal protein-like isoform X3 [Ischnura elegans]